MTGANRTPRTAESTAGAGTRAGRRLRLGLAGVATGAALTMAAGPALAACAERMGEDIAARSVRTLQSDMMVAALSCQAHGLYNAFVTDYRPALKRHGEALRRSFRRDHGAGAMSALDDYVTQLANDAAIRYAKTGSAYCEQARSAMTALVEGEDRALDVYAMRYAVEVKPALAQKVAAASEGAGGGCDELVALNLPE